MEEDIRKKINQIENYLYDTASDEQLMNNLFMTITNANFSTADIRRAIEKTYTGKYKNTPAFNLYKMKRWNGEGSTLKTFGKYIGEGVNYFF